MRFREVFRYELEYRLRSLSTWTYAAFLFLVMCWGTIATADGADAVNANAPQQVAQGIVLFGGLFGMLVSAALFGDAAIRDVAAGMDPLLYTTRLRKTEYLGGRFLAALAINAMVVLALPLGFWVATVTLVEADALGPNRLGAYVQPLVLFVGPNIVLVGTILFTIGAPARQVIPVYLGTACLFIGYIVAANYWNDVQSPLLSALADPLGINALLAMTRYWTPAELEVRLIGFPALLVWNRVLWLAIASGVLVVLHRTFRFAHVDGGVGAGIARWRRRAIVDALPEARWQGTVPRVSGVFGRWTLVQQTLAVARQSLAEVMSGRGFQVGFAAAIGLVLLWGWNVGDTLFDTSTWPVTHLVVGEVLTRRSPFIPWLVIALYAGELVWKYREAGTAEIVDAAPVPTGIALLGRAILFWVRGTEPGVRHRLALARARFRGPAARTAGAAIALILVAGGFVFYNTNVLNEYRGRGEAGLPEAEYERRYKRFEHAPQPVITVADLRVEIYPDEPSAEMRGSYQLVNRTGVAIDSIHVIVDRDVNTRSISLNRASIAKVVDEETGYRILALEQALQPGDSLRLSFDVAFRPRGFRGTSDVQTDVVRNGSYFDRRLLPFVGYQPVLEMSGQARKRFGLAPRAAMPSPDDEEARRHDESVRNEDGVSLEMVVGTAADQTAVVSAPLRRTCTENGRRYFHYGTDVPGRFGASVFSARYAVVESRWRDVELQIFHHPGHWQNRHRMLESMKASLDYYTRTFGPYQFRQLRIVEIPPYSLKGGRALATTIAFAEPHFITRVKEGAGDMMFFGTAHEVAHSWWGGQVSRAHVRGGAVLSESLSNYSAMMLTEKIRGPEEARRVYDLQMDRYLQRRRDFASDVPLVEVGDHPHIAYGKGAVAMYTLREHIGDEAVNAALRRLLEKYRDSGPPYPTALDLVQELRAVTPDSLQYLITDLFETITLWNVRTARAVVERTRGGEYEVTLDIVASKMRADSVGHETETAMDDFVEIGVFAPGTDDGLGVPLYLQRHRIRSGKQTIRITVPRKPARAGIDPWRKLIDRERQDNVVDVKEML